MRLNIAVCSKTGLCLSIYSLSIYFFFFLSITLKQVLTQGATYRRGCEHFTRLNSTHPPIRQARETNDSPFLVSITSQLVCYGSSAYTDDFQRFSDSSYGRSIEWTLLQSIASSRPESPKTYLTFSFFI